MSTDGWKDVDPEFVLEAVRSGAFQVIDLRTPFEYASHHIRGAMLLPIQVLEDLVDAVERDKPTIFVCEHANRSTLACRMLSGMFRELYNMKGGMELWLKKGYEVATGMDELGERWLRHLEEKNQGRTSS